MPSSTRRRLTALANHLSPEVQRSSIDAHWRAAAARLPAQRRPLRAWPVAAAALLGIAVAAWALRPSAARLTVGQGLLAERATVAELPDGSKVELAPGSSVLLHASGPERVELALRTGGARFDVTRRPSRRFTVVVDDVEVAVVGTRFTLRREPGGRVAVEVERGLVDVHARGTLRRLAAGEQWRGPARDRP